MRKKGIELPLQPIVKDDDGVIRFEKNDIVLFLLRACPYDLNKLHDFPFTVEDWEQFSQLIGYSVSGFGDLSYVRNDTYSRIEKAIEEFRKNES